MGEERRVELGDCCEYGSEALMLDKFRFNLDKVALLRILCINFLALSSLFPFRSDVEHFISLHNNNLLNCALFCPLHLHLLVVLAHHTNPRL